MKNDQYVKILKQTLIHLVSYHSFLYICVMIINKLLDLGFKMKFVSIEEGGGKPFLYLYKECPQITLLSEEIEMDYEVNSVKNAAGTLSDNIEKDLEVTLLGSFGNIPNESIILLSKAIDIINGE